jgi:hypothetical protein
MLHLCISNPSEVQFIVLMLVMIWIFRLPESPRWLASKGRHAETLAVLAALEGKPVDDPQVLKTWQGIVDAVSQSAGDFALKELFTHGKSQHFRRTLLGVLAQCFQQSKSSFLKVPCRRGTVLISSFWYQVSSYRYVDQ